MLKTTATTVVFWIVMAAAVFLAIVGLYTYSRDSLSTLLQVICALALVIILFVIAFSVYNMEMVNAVRQSGQVRKAVPIFVGMKDMKSSTNEVYETLDPNASTFKDLRPSVGQAGGTEYSYNFWLYIDQGTAGITPPSASPATPKQLSTDGGIEDAYQAGSSAPATLYNNNKQLVLFLRGSPKVYRFKGLCYDQNDTDTAYKSDIMIKSPLVKLERGLDVLTIEFNTLDSPEAVKERSADTCNDLSTDWESLNAYKIALKNLVTRYDKQWIMITIVLSDTYPTDPIPIRNKIRTSVYVNGVLELDKYIDGQLGAMNVTGSTLKTNYGNFYVNPDIKATNTDIKIKPLSGSSYQSPASPLVVFARPENPRGVVMSDLTYYNYAPDVAEVKSWFSAGFTKKWAPSIAAAISLNSDNEFMEQVPVQPDDPVLKQINK